MRRSHYILLILLCIQVLLILLWRPSAGSGTFQETGGLDSGSALFPEFSIERAVTIELISGQQSIVLKKRPGSHDGWTFEAGGAAYKADNFRIESLMTTFADLKEGSIHSQNLKKAGIFGLDEASALRIAVLDEGGESQARLWVGKNSDFVSGNYVMVPGKQKILLVPDNLRYLCLGDGEDWAVLWRDKNLFPYEQSIVHAIEVTAASSRFVVERRSDEAWRLIEPHQGPVKKEAIKAMLDALSSMKIQGKAPEGASINDLGLDNPDLMLFVSLQEGAIQKKLVFKLGREQDGLRYLQVGDREPAFYRIPGYLFTPFRVNATDLTP